MTDANAPRRLSPVEITLIREIFNVFDIAGEGAISARELGSLLNAFGIQNLLTHDLRKLLTKYDADNSGLLDFEEFITLLEDYFPGQVSTLS